MEFRPVGDQALLVDVAAPERALALALWARHRGVAATDVVPAARTVLFDGVTDLGALKAELEGWTPTSASQPGPLVEIPVVYDGVDLDAVAQRWGISAEQAVARHAGVEFVAQFCGFAPGFAYLAGLPPALRVPRRSTPRTIVPAGSVALADTWCGIYPVASPGGWQLIGRTSVTVWDPAADPPALLSPGTRVRFAVCQ